jgi:hypothetical protein
VEIILSENQIAKEVMDIAFQVHKQYGPGLFESVYEEIMCYELHRRNLSFTSQQGIPLVHESIKFEAGFRAEALAPVHYKQVQTYLKLTGLKLGLLINFNTALIKEGIHRIVNNLPN